MSAAKKFKPDSINKTSVKHVEDVSACMLQKFTFVLREQQQKKMSDEIEVNARNEELEREKDYVE